jgi:sulfide:quinone oxidoreductase
MAGKTVVILGAGVGGLVAANRLRRMLGKEHRVVLIDRSPLYVFAPSFTWVMLGQRNINQISRDLRKLEKKGIEFKAAEVTGFDFDNKRVLHSTGQVVYDYLIVSLGVDYTAEDVPGLHRAWSFYHAEGAEGLRDALTEFKGGRVAVVVPTLPYRCPPAPYEGAMLLDHHFRKKKFRGDVELKVITPEKQPLMAAGEGVGEGVLQLLKERDIAFAGGMSLKSVNLEKRLLNFADGPKEEFDMLIATPVHKLPLVVAGTPLVDGGAWIPVDRETMQR